MVVHVLFLRSQDVAGIVDIDSSWKMSGAGFRGMFQSYHETGPRDRIGDDKCSEWLPARTVSTQR